MNFRTNTAFRKESLTKLLHVILSKEDAILQALYDDFKKPAFESLITETNFVISDLKHAIKNLDSWAKPKSVLPAFLNFPSNDFICHDAYGKVLIIAPWNYPFHLALCPLIAAVAAGNQVVLKPSELTPHTSSVIAGLIAESFHPNHVTVVEGGVPVAQELLSQRWDYIFFTGSVPVGKIVAKAAAEFLTPVTLELGGKSPCIVHDSASLQLAAKRIVWGKFLNAGQTCIAPDYLLIHRSVKPKFIEYLKQEIVLAYGGNPEISPDFARIINPKNWQRLCALLKDGTIVHGGQSTEQDCFLAPTLVDEPSLESALMTDEIFGPLLPMLAYETEADIAGILSRYEKPLSLYVFATDKEFIAAILRDHSFGGGCVNDVVVHLNNKRLPFGGVGHSGIGVSHGKHGFDTFTHDKSIVRRANWLDLPTRYAPYAGKLKSIRKLLKWL